MLCCRQTQPKGSRWKRWDCVAEPGPQRAVDTVQRRAHVGRSSLKDCLCDGRRWVPSQLATAHRPLPGSRCQVLKRCALACPASRCWSIPGCSLPWSGAIPPPCPPLTAQRGRQRRTAAGGLMPSWLATCSCLQQEVSAGWACSLWAALLQPAAQALGEGRACAVAARPA